VKSEIAAVVRVERCGQGIRREWMSRRQRGKKADKNKYREGSWVMDK